MQVIRVRHDLSAPEKALLATLGWDYVIDPAAPPCARFVENTSRGMGGMRFSDRMCPKCKQVSARG